MLRAASEGSITETFRINVPGRVVAFGKRDTIDRRYPAAVDAATEAGFAAVERMAGGRAAVFTEHTLSFAWTIPDVDPRPGITARFAALAELVVDAFARLGIMSDIGEIPGEYCPGSWSVHHDGRLKLMGVGQRLARNAAHVGGVIVVGRPDLVRARPGAGVPGDGLGVGPGHGGSPHRRRPFGHGEGRRRSDGRRPRSGAGAPRPESPSPPHPHRLTHTSWLLASRLIARWGSPPSPRFRLTP